MLVSLHLVAGSLAVAAFLGSTAAMPTPEDALIPVRTVNTTGARTRALVTASATSVPVADPQEHSIIFHQHQGVVVHSILPRPPRHSSYIETTTSPFPIGIPKSTNKPRSVNETNQSVVHPPPYPQLASPRSPSRKAQQASQPPRALHRRKQ